MDAHVVPDVKTRAIKGKKRGLRHSLESSICTFALSSANGRSRPVGRKGVRGSPQMCRLINLILIEHLNMAALWWSASCKPPSQEVVVQTKGQFTYNENQSCWSDWDV